MQKPFGTSLILTFSPARSLLSLGPGWAALSGVLAGGVSGWSLALLLQLLGLWVLAELVLGSLWHVVVQQNLWQQLTQPNLPASPRRGFLLPYAQPGSPAGRFSVWARRYRRWWVDDYWPRSGSGALTLLLGSGLALLLAAVLGGSIFLLVVLALTLVLLAGILPGKLDAAGGGRLQSVVEFLLPWGMGGLLLPESSPLALLLGMCFWATYLGGLRMLGGHRQADWLFFLGQVTALALLLALRLLPGAALFGVLLTAQLVLHHAKKNPAHLLLRAQPYLVIGLLAAAISLGGWSG